MAAAKKKTQSAAPTRVDPTAPPPTPDSVNVRGRASRPTFRRGGLVFGDRDWTPIEPEAIGAVASLAILTDPVISIQGRDKDGGWSAMPAEIRAGLIEVLQKGLAEEKTDAA